MYIMYQSQPDFAPLTMDLPPGLVRADLTREKVRSGQYVLWTNAAGTVFRMGKVSVWGVGLQHISCQCRLKGHKGCKRAGQTFNVSYDLMEDWLLAGVGLDDEGAHMSIPVQFIAIINKCDIFASYVECFECTY